MSGEVPNTTWPRAFQLLSDWAWGGATSKEGTWTPAKESGNECEFDKGKHSRPPGWQHVSVH